MWVYMQGPIEPDSVESREHCWKARKPAIGPKASWKRGPSQAGSQRMGNRALTPFFVETSGATPILSLLPSSNNALCMAHRGLQGAWFRNASEKAAR